MPLAAGQTLSFYEIIRPLGAGGMGEVYLAKDTRLDREVAIKVLPEELLDDEERLRRFEREAKTLASLNHPNVGGIHGVDRVDGVSFLALELVPGEDLSSQLSRGPLPVDEAIEVCRQIAEGLEIAHETGVIHRDLKPANVRITPDGVIKLLDFGLAKAVGPGSGKSSTSDSDLITEEGRLFGTPIYMAPEQARGKPIDKRVDVWAFGCVLYECLVCRRPFEGETLGDVLVAVLEKEPDWTQLPTATPARVRRLIERCLNKDPRTRLRDIGEARIILEQGGRSSALLPVEPGPRAVLAAVLPIAGAAVASALILGALGQRWLGGSQASTSPIVSAQRLTEVVGMEEMPTISPDGKALAFVAPVNGRRQIFVRLIAEGTPEPITSLDADHGYPRWIDDNSLVYFVAPEDDSTEGGLWETLYIGAYTPTFVGPADGEADVSHSGERLATLRRTADGTALVLINRATQAEGVWLLPDGSYASPRWSPDDTSVAFVSLTGLGSSELLVINPIDGKIASIAETGQIRGIAWLPDGSGLVYSSSEGSSLAYPPVFHLRAVGIDGGGDAPLPMVKSSYASYIQPDISEAGQLVATRVRLDSDIYRFPVDGEPQENVLGELRITHQTGHVQVPSVSPDGKEVVYLSDNGGHCNLWIAHVDGSSPPRPLTDERDPHVVIGIPVWAPKGDLIAYYREFYGGQGEQWLIRSDGRDPRALAATGGAAAWSLDAQWLYHMSEGDAIGHEASTVRVGIHTGEVEAVIYGLAGLMVTEDGKTGFSSSPAKGDIVWKVSLPLGEPEVLVQIPEPRIPMWPHRYALSPDEQWLAAPLKDRGTTNLWLISTIDGSFKQVTDFRQRSTLIGRQVSWSRDGKFLFAAVMDTDADVVLLEGALQGR